MKKIFYLAIALVCSLSALATNYNYKAAITKVTVEDQSYGTTYKFKVSLTQTCLNTSDNKTYDSTADLFLVSETPDLEGTYSVSSGSINPDLSAIYYGSNTRRPNKDKQSTFTIVKKDATHYEIGNGVINVQNMQGTNQYCYNYSYSTSDWTVNTPFAFTYGSSEEEKTEPHIHYDMTVKGVHVERQDNDYGSIRYFMVLNCTGKRRDNNTNYNYEVQLDLLPSSASISGTFATTGAAQILAPTDTYVKWIQSETSSKTRFVAKDSLSTITIKSNGTNQYKFCGGTLICQDITFGVMGDKQINPTLYYHFNDEVDFGFDEDKSSHVFTPTAIDVEESVDGYTYTLKGTVDGINYTILIINESSNKSGTFTTSNSLSLWTKVEHGSVSSYIVENGSTVTIQTVGSNLYSLSGTLICENDNTYEIESINFSYPTATAMGAVRNEAAGRKVLRGGRVMIEREGVIYNTLGQMEK